MWAIRGLNMDLLRKDSGRKFMKREKQSNPQILIYQKNMDGVVKLCVLDGVSRRWIMDEMKETPEEIIDYVMPIIKTL